MKTHTHEWMLARVTVGADQAERAEETLFSAGASSVTLLDAGDHPVHEPGPGEIPLWPKVVVQGLFPAEAERDAIIGAITGAGLVDTATAIGFEPLIDRDWERAWMDQYRPMRFGRSLWICPSHLEPDPGWPLVIRLDPGLAFGSGTHPTTALCLEWIDGENLAETTVVDYGCGSGVLAIACALKGAERVIAVDHDPQALTATLDNARRNGVDHRIGTVLPAAFEQLPPEQRRADLVLANILTGPLIDLAPRLTDCLGANARLVLSGTLLEQADDVRAAYEHSTGFVEQTERQGWIRLVFSSPDAGPA